MLRMNGVVGLRFCSFGTAEVLWMFRDDRELGKVVGKGGMSKAQHGDGQMLCLSTQLFPWLPGRAPNPPSQPHFSWQQKGALILVRD